MKQKSHLVGALNEHKNYSVVERADVIPRYQRNQFKKPPGDNTTYFIKLYIIIKL